MHLHFGCRKDEYIFKKNYCHIRVNDSFSNDILLASFAQAPLTYSSDNAQI